MKKKIALLMACVMAFGVAIGGTLAWLTHKTDPVTNTFTPSNITIELKEHVDTNNDGAESFKMVPGDTIAKDPYVVVKAGSEKCYLFVAVTADKNLAEEGVPFFSYSVRNDWTLLDGKSNIYYRVVGATSTDTAPMYILTGKDGYANGYVTVNDGVTKTHMEALFSDPSKQPTLSFTACAVQFDHMENEQAAFDAAAKEFRDLAIAAAANP